MRSATTDLTISTARADALFASPLQRSDAPTPAQVHQAIAAAVAAFGIRGCAARVAQAYGEHPETAARRMRWARATLTRAPVTHAPVTRAPATRAPATRRSGSVPVSSARMPDSVPAGSACVPAPRQAHLSYAA
jgi:hypothetical protein